MAVIRSLCLFIFLLSCISVTVASIFKNDFTTQACVTPLLKYSPTTLRSLRPSLPSPPLVDTSFIKQRKRGRKGGVKTKFRRRHSRPFLPSVMTGNVRSLCNKIDELSSLCKYCCDYRQASIITLTESWLTPNTPTSAVNIDKYSLFRMDRNNDKKKRGGGVCTYINNNWCHPNNISTNFSYCDNNIEILTLSIRPFYLPREFCKILSTTVYIPPTADANAATDILIDHIEREKTKSPDSVHIVTGDFNHSSTMKIPGHYQFVDCPTRNNSILDLFYCNVPNSFKCLPRPPLGSSDHNMLLLLPSYRPVVKRIKPIKKCVEVWNESVCEELRGCFELTDWNVFIDTCDSVDDLNDCVSEYVKFCEQVVCEKKEVTCYPNNKPWITKELKLLLNEKKYIFGHGNRAQLKIKQKEIKSEIMRCKEEYKQKVEKSFYSGNIKDTWKGMKTIVNYTQNKAKTPENVNLDELNMFYSRFDTKDNVYDIESALKSLEEGMNEECMVEFSEYDTKMAFSKLNERKATGPDGIKGKILKECAEQLCYIYTFIFNMSMSCSTIPSIWKTSEIIPVPKKDKITSMNDFRPVALTSIVMKSFEKLILQKIGYQIKPLLDPNQFAYQTKRSVEDAILVFTNNIYKHLDIPKSYCRILFVDFSSAFNTIQPHILAKKLVNLHINNFIISWLLEFLTDRIQYVQVRGNRSKQIVTNTGAPQGCVISPMLFILYTNDCISSHINVPLLKFADDSTLQGLILNNDETNYHNEISNFVSWCDNNHLELNVSKTKELIIDFRKIRNTKEKLIIKGETVEQVESYKYLGVTVDNKLQWTEHTKNIKSKINKRMYFLRKLSQFNIDKTLCTLFYRSVIESIITFCITAWGGNCQNVEKTKFRKTIRRAEKFTLRLTPFDDLYSLFSLNKICGIVADSSHPLNFHLTKSVRSDRLLAIRTKSERHRRSFLPHSIRLFNSKQ